MRCGAEINGNMEQSTSVRATLLCQRLQTSAHHRSNEYLTVPCLLFYRLYFYDSLEIRFIECKPWVQSTVGPNKAPWHGIDAQVKVVYYSSLQWTVDTSHRNIDSERELQRYLFFPLRTALCSLGKRHITYDAKWQQNDPPSNVSCPSWIKQLFNLDISIYIYILFLSYLCLNCV